MIGISSYYLEYNHLNIIIGFYVFILICCTDKISQVLKLYSLILIIFSMLFIISLTIFITYLALFLIFNVKKYLSRSTNKIKIAFFHPFCNDGGGGEKVLWCILKQLLKHKEYQIAVYSLQPNKQQILTKAKNRFNIDLTSYQDLKFLHVSNRNYLTSKGFLTMLFHIILPGLYTIKCLWNYQPCIFYDTTGFAFNFFFVKLLLPTTKCFAYVHYPFISIDMIRKIQERRLDFNNQSRISHSQFLTKLKIIYYKLILFTYKMIRYFTAFVQTNSSWTHNHMSLLWSQNLNKQLLVKVYPPCSIEQFGFNKELAEKKTINIFSLAQFRPQKNQILQINVLSKLLQRNKSLKIKLNICGTTRGKDDEDILEQLKKRTKQLNIQQFVQFKVNMSFSQLLQAFKQADIGIHTMQAEHFGISVVEMMAAGLLVVAHNSAGPKQDIIKDIRYLAASEQQYIEKVQKIIRLESSQRKKLSNQFRKKAYEFGEQQFANRFYSTFSTALKIYNFKQHIKLN